MWLLALSLAHAASCCAPAAGLDPGVLGSWEKVGASVAVAGGDVLGSWTWDGRWVATSGERRDRVSTLVGGMLRVAPAWQLGLAVPVIATTRGDGSGRVSSLGPGDVSLRLRWDAPSGSTGVPARPDLSLSVTAPTGDEGAPGGALGSGQALTALTAGWERTGTWGWRVEARAGVGMADAVVPELGLGLEGAWHPEPDWSFRASAGIHADTAGLVRPSLGLAAVWTAGPHLRVAPSVRGGPPVGGLGRNAELWGEAGVSVVMVGLAD